VAPAANGGLFKGDIQQPEKGCTSINHKNSVFGFGEWPKRLRHMSEQQEPLKKRESETSLCYLSTEDLVASYLDAPTLSFNKSLLTPSSAGFSFFDDN
jgi:hypothetical protein